MKVKVLSWNIWQGRHLDLVAEHLKRSKPDIVGLQEVTEYVRDGKKFNTAEHIATLLGYDFAYYKAITNDRHEIPFDQGNAILSRYPIVRSTCHFLSGMELYKRTAETEPRTAVKAEISLNGQSYNFFSTHLAYAFRFQPNPIRDLQVDTLIKVIPKEKAILIGDFNCPAESNEIKKISSHLRNADRDALRPTWTVYPYEREGFKEDNLAWRLDHIFVTHDVNVDQFSVESSKGSDHLPVSMIFEV